MTLVSSQVVVAHVVVVQGKVVIVVVRAAKALIGHTIDQDTILVPNVTTHAIEMIDVVVPLLIMTI